MIIYFNKLLPMAVDILTADSPTGFFQVETAAAYSGFWFVTQLHTYTWRSKSFRGKVLLNVLCDSSSKKNKVYNFVSLNLLSLLDQEFLILSVDKGCSQIMWLSYSVTYILNTLVRYYLRMKITMHCSSCTFIFKRIF